LASPLGASRPNKSAGRRRSRPPSNATRHKATLKKHDQRLSSNDVHLLSWPVSRYQSHRRLSGALQFETLHLLFCFTFRLASPGQLVRTPRYRPSVTPRPDCLSGQPDLPVISISVVSGVTSRAPEVLFRAGTIRIRVSTSTVPEVLAGVCLS
jgi:hypothetical protein